MCHLLPKNKEEPNVFLQVVSGVLENQFLLQKTFHTEVRFLSAVVYLRWMTLSISVFCWVPRNNIDTQHLSYMWAFTEKHLNRVKRSLTARISIFFMQLRYHMSNLLSIALRSTNIKATRDRIMVSWWLRCFSNYFQGFCFPFCFNKKISLKTSQVLIKSITFPGMSSKKNVLLFRFMSFGRFIRRLCVVDLIPWTNAEFFA